MYDNMSLNSYDDIKITYKIGTGDQAKEFLFSSLQKLYLYNIFRYNQKLQHYRLFKNSSR